MPSHHISSKLQKKWHSPSIFHSRFANYVDFKNDTRLSLHHRHATQIQISISFFHGAKLLKGQRSFLPPKGSLVFAIRKLEQLQGPQPQQLDGSWPVEKYHHKNCLKHKPIFCRKRRSGIFFAKKRKKTKKKDLFCVSVSLHLQTWPKGTEDCSTVSGVTQKQTIRDVIADQGKFSHVLFFFQQWFKKLGFGTS